MRALPVLLLLLATPLVPGGAALAACLPPGCIGGHLFGYNPPLAVVRAGAPVQWASLDGDTHTSTEGVGEAAAPCFDEFFRFTATRAVVFGFDSQGLAASTAGGPPLPCTAALALAPGASLVPYFCRLHAAMKGSILVVA